VRITWNKVSKKDKWYQSHSSPPPIGSAATKCVADLPFTPFASSQLSCWRMMTCQRITGIMDYARRSDAVVWMLSHPLVNRGETGNACVIAVVLPPPWSPTLSFFSPPPPFPPDLPPPPPVVPPIPPPTHKQRLRSCTPRSTESNLHPSCASRQKERNKYRWSYHQHMMNLDQ
jgi:hypothetical protein